MLLLTNMLKLFSMKFIFKNTYIETINSCSSFGIDPYLILSIIKAESNFSTFAVSKKEAYGLMQILYSTAFEINDELNLVENLNKEDLYDVRINITIGTKYFSDLIKRYNGNYYLAICAYNAGLGNVDKWIEEGIIDSNFTYKDYINIPYKETRTYFNNVISNYKIYRFLY